MNKKTQIIAINLTATLCGILLLAFAIPLSIYLSRGADPESTLIISLSVAVSIFSILCLTCGFFQIFNFSSSHMPWLQMWAGWFNVFLIFVFLSLIFSFIIAITANKADEHYEMVKRYKKFEEKEYFDKQQRWNEELNKQPNNQNNSNSNISNNNNLNNSQQQNNNNQQSINNNPNNNNQQQTNDNNQSNNLNNQNQSNNNQNNNSDDKK